MNRRHICLLIAFTILILLFTGCGNRAKQQDEKAEGAINVTDMRGREITLAAPATRVVALSAADCEIICAIGGQAALVGRGEYCDYPAEVLDVPSVQSGAETNLEQILALKPQVLLMSDMAQTKEQVQTLEDAGVKVVVSYAKDIEGTYTAIELIGKLMGKEQQAADVIESMKATFVEISAATEGEEEKTVYFEVSPLEYGLWTAGNGTFMNEMCQLMGLKNAFADVEGWGEISQEQVIERDPDYIVTITMYSGTGPTPEEEIAARSGWEDITAVKNGAILNLPNNELSRPAPRLADGARLMSEFIKNAEAQKRAA